jgi:hypothetical protein
LVSKSNGEDIAFFLYLVPIVAGIAYGVYEWYEFGPHSNSMPGYAYVVVSKSPYLFLGALVAICVGFLIELRSTPVNERTTIVSANTTRMQILAIIVLVLSLAAAISASNYNLTNGVGSFLTGRYALIFAFFLIGFSILLSPRQLVGNVKLNVAPEFVGLLVMAISPFVLYGAIKLHLPYAAAGIAALAVLVIGVAIFLSGSKLFKKKSAGSPDRRQAPKIAAPA